MDLKVLQAYKVNELFSNSKIVKSKSSKSEGSKDTLKISEEARAFGDTIKTLASVPDIREEKVEALKEKLESGTYDVTSSDIAKKIYDNYLTFRKSLL